jgi:hypothetical protein
MANRVDSANRELRRVLRRAVPTAPGVGLTRHPQTGAALQPRLLYGNLLKIQWLAASHFKWSALHQLLVPVWELVDFMG